MRSEIHVVDVGSRYGIHPSWRGFEDVPIKFFLFEADHAECERLRRKYETSRGYNQYEVSNLFLGADTRQAVLLIRENAAMSGSLERSPSRLFSGNRADQELIEAEVSMPSTTLDAQFLPGSVDFLKLDTEGSELEILRGGERLLETVLGLRLEVSFNSVFRNGPLFSEVDLFLRSHGFSLLNLDFNGRGDLQHRFVSPTSNYGILNSTDAVYIKGRYADYPFSIESDVAGVIRLLRICLFLCANGAMDLCLALLEEQAQIINSYAESNAIIAGLHHQLSIRIERHFYTLKWIPNQDLTQHIAFFEGVFRRELRSGTRFMSSTELNPL